jgi:hypothetical protein
MVVQVTVGERDLRCLVPIASDHSDDLPADGLALSLLVDLMGQIRCDVISFEEFDGGQHKTWFSQSIPGRGGAVAEDLGPVRWQHCWGCQPCSYADRPNDLRSIVKIAVFYSARQGHSIRPYCDIYRPQGFENDPMLALRATRGPGPVPGRDHAAVPFRGSGLDVCEHDGALLGLLCPHLQQAYLDAERVSQSIPQLTPGTGTCCAWSPPGTLTARSSAASDCPFPPGKRVGQAPSPQPNSRRHPRYPRYTSGTDHTHSAAAANVCPRRTLVPD